jgi:hypothetical protein
MTETVTPPSSLERIVNLALSEALSNGAFIDCDIHVKKNFDEAQLKLRSNGQTVSIWIDDCGSMSVSVDKTTGVHIGGEYVERDE